MTVPVLAPRPGRTVIPTPTRPQLMLTHCESEWSALYPKIERLYIRERRKLRYIMQHMESEHGFVATKQMYKKRLAKWGLQKNTRRAVPTKSSSKTQAQCQKAPATSVSSSDSTSDSTPSAIISIPASPDVSHCDGSMLMLLTNVRTWSVAFFESTVQFRDELLQQNLTAWQIWHANNKSINFAFKLVVDLLDRGKGDMAGRMARKAFMLVEDMLTLEGPALVWNLFEMMHHIVTLRHARLFQMLLAHVTALAATKKPENHPLPLLLRGLTDVVRSLTNTASRSANSSPSSLTGADREKVPLNSGHISQHVAPLLERIWIMNAELLFQHFDPRLFHLYCRVIWDSCSINPPAMIVNSADYWINRIDNELLPEMTGAASLDNPTAPDDSYGQRSTFVQSLLAPRLDCSPPRDYEMLRTSSIAALRQYGSALARQGVHDLKDTTKLFGVLAGLATANVLERPPTLKGELGAFDNMGIEELLRLHAGNFACVLRILVDLDSELGGNELWATLDAVERIRVMVRLREYSEGKLDPQVIRELWLLRDALVASGKSEEADVVEKDVYDRMESFIEDISAYSG